MARTFTKFVIFSFHFVISQIKKVNQRESPLVTDSQTTFRKI